MRKTLFALGLFLALNLAALAQSNPNVTGTWEGESICTVRPSPCHDEHVIYDIKAGKPITLSMDKVVNGERENMGSVDCEYSAGKLRCLMPNGGLWEFTVREAEMIGTLKLRDGTLYRNIHVKRR